MARAGDTDALARPDGDTGRGERVVAVEIAKFALAGVVALVIVGLATAIASRRLGEREAIVDARTTTVLKAQGLVEPAVTDALLREDPRAVRRVDRVVRRDVLDANLVRVKLWSADGTIIYSDEERLIGDAYDLGEEQRSAIETGRIEAEVSSLDGPENRFERSYGRLLEVYLPIGTPSGQRVLFEAYFRYESVSEKGSRLWRSFAPITLGALLMLQLVQLPVAWSLARRLRARLREREGLLQRALQASEVERRQIASDLHDGAVQDLAGVAYGLSAAVRRAEPEGAKLLDESAEGIRKTIRELRSLIVDIYPPDLSAVSFGSAMTELLARAQERGLEARLDLDGLQDPLPDPIARLLYRAAQEGLRNVLTHADATAVDVRVSPAQGSVVLEVIDDGRGLPDGADVARPGHVGLVALRGLVADAGGSVDVGSAHPRGTRLRVEVPV